MKLFFSSPDWNAQMMRSLSYIHSGGADLVECLSATAKMEEGNCESWDTAWNSLADHVFEEAHQALEEGHRSTAMRRFLRASNYYRNASYFHLFEKNDPLLLERYEKHLESFEEAISLFHIKPESFKVPFKGHTIPCRLYLCSNERRPLVIINYGYDSTKEESYLSLGRMALQRGYHVLTFDGPGQGEMFLKQGVTMDQNWNHVITALINEMRTHSHIDSEAIVLVGRDWGGMLGSIAASQEKRIAALVTYPAHYDPLLGIQKFIPDIEEKLNAGDSSNINTSFAQAMTSKAVAFKFKIKMNAHGVDTPYALLKEWQHWSIDEKIPKIHCPTLVINFCDDPINQGQAKLFFDKLTCPKEWFSLKGIDASELGQCAHTTEKLFDWLEYILHNALVGV